MLRTDRYTDRLTDIATYRAAIATKNEAELTQALFNLNFDLAYPKPEIIYFFIFDQ